MAAPIEYNIRILDNASSPLKSVGKGFEDTEKGAKKAGHEVELFEAEAGRLKETVGGLTVNLQALSSGGAFFTFDLAEGFRAAYDVAERLVEKVVEVGVEAIKTVARTGDLNFALRANLGVEGADEVDRLADSFERTTRLDASEVKSAVLPLTEAGIKNVQLLDSIATTAADISARRNTGVEGFNAYVGALGDIALKGGTKIRGNLRELAIKPAEYYGALGQLLGKSAKEAEALASAGKLANDTLLSTAIHVVALREGGEIGRAAVDSAGTLGGIITRLQNTPENLFERLIGTDGMVQAERVLGSILDRLNGPDGVRLVEQFGAAMGDAFRSVSSDDVVSAIELVSDLVGGIVKGLGYAVKLAGTINDIGGRRADLAVGVGQRVKLADGRSLTISAEERDQLLERAGWTGPLARFARWADMHDAIYGSINRDKRDADALEQLAKETGQNFGRGVREGIEQSSPQVAQASISLAQDAHAAAAGPEGFDSHSPSRKGIALGRYYALGIQEGISSEAAALQLSATSTIAQTIEAAPTARGAAGQGVSIYAPITVTEAKDARATARIIRDELEKVFYGARLALGDAA